MSQPGAWTLPWPPFGGSREEGETSFRGPDVGHAGAGPRNGRAGTLLLIAVGLERGTLKSSEFRQSCHLGPCLWPPREVTPRVVSDLCFLSAVNPCCYYPCQHQGVCVRFGLDRYRCDCTRTGYSGPNCTIRELGLQPPTPSVRGSSCSPGLLLRDSPLPALVSGHGPILFLAWLLISDTLSALGPHSLVPGSEVRLHCPA